MTKRKTKLRFEKKYLEECTKAGSNAFLLALFPRFCELEFHIAKAPSLDRRAFCHESLTLSLAALCSEAHIVSMIMTKLHAPAHFELNSLERTLNANWSP